MDGDVVWGGDIDEGDEGRGIYGVEDREDGGCGVGCCKYWDVVIFEPYLICAYTAR